jgi:hypothetical protein
MAFLGDLVIRMKADTADFRSDLGKAQQSAQSMARGITGALTTATAAFAGLSAAAAAYQVVEALTHTLETAENFNKLAQKTGIAAEELSAYSVAAKLADVPQEALDTGLKKLAVNMAAAAGGAKEQAAVFSALGVKVTESNGALRKTNDVLDDVGKAFEEIKDGPGKAALAVALFGKSGDSMIPLLNNLRETKDEARKLGVVIGSDFARNAEEFNDNMKRVSIAGDALKITIANHLLPRLVEISKEFVTAAENGNKLLGALNALSQAAGFTDPARVAAQKAMITLAEREEKIRQSMTDIQNNANMFGGEPNAVQQRQLNAARAGLFEIQAERERLTKILDVGDPGIQNALNPKPKQRDAPILDKTSAESTAKEEARQKQLTDLYIKGVQARQRENDEWNAYLASSNAQQTQESIDGFAESAKGMQEAMEAARKAEEELAYATAKAISDNQVKLQKEATKEITEFWRGAARNMQSAMGDFFFNVMEGNLQDLGSSFARAMKKMVADVLAAKAATALFGTEFGKGGDIGGLVGGALTKFATGGIFDGMGGEIAAASSAGTLTEGWAEGGPIWRGQSGWVGENGPEWINAGVSGNVTPNGGGGATVYIDATGADAAGLARVEAQLRRMDATFERRAVAATVDANIRGRTGQ